LRSGAFSDRLKVQDSGTFPIFGAPAPVRHKQDDELDSKKPLTDHSRMIRVAKGNTKPEARNAVRRFIVVLSG